MSKTVFALAVSAVSLLASPAFAADVFGYWLTESKKAIVEVKQCGALACGEVVWLAEPNDEAGVAKTDIHNPDASQRARGICGMSMIGDFERGEGEWVNGFIYNPEDGKTYKSKMKLNDEGNLYVRGYVGIPLLGKSQIWTREETARTGC